MTDTNFITTKKSNSAGILIPGTISFALLLLIPVITLVTLSLSGDLESFIHIATNVMPSAGSTTILLMIGVGLFVAIVGTITAWLVTYFDFPLRKSLQWLLVLPLAVPTYISAYTFVEFFSYTGPTQELIRWIGGYTSSREYWFPEIRSLGGTVFVLGLVLYPYVYLSVRTLLLLQGTNISDSARVLGKNGIGLFFSITVPLVRPAIVLGVTLALMETINDIGAVEYLGTKTLTFSVFSVWLNQNDLAGAAQIAIFLLLIVIGLILIEHRSRGARRFHDLRSNTKKTLVRTRLTGKHAIIALVVTVLPVIIGFGVPIAVLIEFAAKDLGDLLNPDLLEALFTTSLLGIFAAILAVIGGFLLSYAIHKKPSRVVRTMVRFSTVGYAIPGTLIALGVFIPLALFDNSLDAVMRQYLGVSTGLLLTGSGFALVFAYVVRFMAMAEGSLENGFSKISPNIELAARNLGRSEMQAFRTVLLPLMRPAIIAASILVFVDVVKELSATILLRPFGMNTLATQVYDFASQGRVEDGALACILIILVGLLPVIFLAKTHE